jgi:hypothetical protein
MWGSSAAGAAVACRLFWRGKAGGGSICHRPREPLSPVAFSGGARRGAAVACRLFRQDRGSSQGVLTPPLAYTFIISVLHNVRIMM